MPAVLSTSSATKNAESPARDVRSQTQDDYQTGNYPPEGDATSEGGYGTPNVFSPLNQRRADKSAQQTQTPGGPASISEESNSGPSLVDQSLDDGLMSSEM